jgi:hypothetical protein
MSEHATHHALETLSKWGHNPSVDGGENIGFSLSRQGAPGDAFTVLGDCTPFTPGGPRGTLHGQPVGGTGAPVDYALNFGGSTVTVDQLPVTFTFDLNNGVVTVVGNSGLPPTLTFSVAFFSEFTGSGGKNIVFVSRESSDKAGYVLCTQLVGAS